MAAMVLARTSTGKHKLIAGAVSAQALRTPQIYMKNKYTIQIYRYTSSLHNFIYMGN